MIELLVVVSIIALLVSILIPSLASAREAAKRVVCSSNLHQLGLGCLHYANDFGGHMPYNALGDPALGFGWRASPRLLMGDNNNNRFDYVTYEVYNCPSMPLTPPMGDFPIIEYYGDGFDEHAINNGWSIGKSVKGSYEWVLGSITDSWYVDHPNAPLLWDNAAGIFYFQDPTVDPRFFLLISHEREGGNVGHFGGDVAWLPAAQWEAPRGANPPVE